MKQFLFNNFFQFALRAIYRHPMSIYLPGAIIFLGAFVGGVILVHAAPPTVEEIMARLKVERANSCPVSATIPDAPKDIVQAVGEGGVVAVATAVQSILGTLGSTFAAVTLPSTWKDLVFDKVIRDQDVLYAARQIGCKEIFLQLELVSKKLRSRYDEALKLEVQHNAFDAQHGKLIDERAQHQREASDLEKQIREALDNRRNSSELAVLRLRLNKLQSVIAGETAAILAQDTALEKASLESRAIAQDIARLRDEFARLDRERQRCNEFVSKSGFDIDIKGILKRSRDDLLRFANCDPQGKENLLKTLKKEFIPVGVSVLTQILDDGLKVNPQYTATRSTSEDGLNDREQSTADLLKTVFDNGQNSSKGKIALDILLRRVTWNKTRLLPILTGDAGNDALVLEAAVRAIVGVLDQLNSGSFVNDCRNRLIDEANIAAQKAIDGVFGSAADFLRSVSMVIARDSQNVVQALRVLIAQVDAIFKLIESIDHTVQLLRTGLDDIKTKLNEKGASAETLVDSIDSMIDLLDEDITKAQQDGGILSQVVDAFSQSIADLKDRIDKILAHETIEDRDALCAETKQLLDRLNNNYRNDIAAFEARTATLQSNLANVRSKIIVVMRHGLDDPSYEQQAERELDDLKKQERIIHQQLQNIFSDNPDRADRYKSYMLHRDDLTKARQRLQCDLRALGQSITAEDVIDLLNNNGTLLEAKLRDTLNRIPFTALLSAEGKDALVQAVKQLLQRILVGDVNPQETCKVVRGAIVSAFQPLFLQKLYANALKDPNDSTQQQEISIPVMRRIIQGLIQALQDFKNDCTMTFTQVFERAFRNSFGSEGAAIMEKLAGWIAWAEVIRDLDALVSLLDGSLPTALTTPPHIGQINLVELLRDATQTILGVSDRIASGINDLLQNIENITHAFGSKTEPIDQCVVINNALREKISTITGQEAYAVDFENKLIGFLGKYKVAGNDAARKSIVRDLLARALGGQSVDTLKARTLLPEEIKSTFFDFLSDFVTIEQDLRVLRADRVKLERWARQLRCDRAPTVTQPGPSVVGPVPFPTTDQQSLCSAKRRRLSDIDATIIKIHTSPASFTIQGYVNDLQKDSRRPKGAPSLKSLSYLLRTLIAERGELILVMRDLGCSFYEPTITVPLPAIADICRPLIAKIKKNREEFKKLNEQFNNTSIAVNLRKKIGKQLSDLDIAYTALRADSVRYHCDLWDLVNDLLDPVTPQETTKKEVGKLDLNALLRATQATRKVAAATNDEIKKKVVAQLVDPQKAQVIFFKPVFVPKATLNPLGIDEQALNVEIVALESQIVLLEQQQSVTIIASDLTIAQKISELQARLISKKALRNIIKELLNPQPGYDKRQGTCKELRSSIAAISLPLVAKGLADAQLRFAEDKESIEKKWTVQVYESAIKKLKFFAVQGCGSSLTKIVIQPLTSDILTGGKVAEELAKLGVIELVEHIDILLRELDGTLYFVVDIVNVVIDASKTITEAQENATAAVRLLGIQTVVVPFVESLIAGLKEKFLDFWSCGVTTADQVVQNLRSVIQAQLKKIALEKFAQLQPKFSVTDAQNLESAINGDEKAFSRLLGKITAGKDGNDAIRAGIVVRIQLEFLRNIRFYNVVCEMKLAKALDDAAVKVKSDVDSGKVIDSWFSFLNARELVIQYKAKGGIDESVQQLSSAIHAIDILVESSAENLETLKNIGGQLRKVFPEQR